MMVVLINHLINMTYNTCDKYGEMMILKGHTTRKGWMFSLSTKSVILHKNMAKFNRNLLPDSIGYMPYSMVRSFLLFEKQHIGLGCQHHHHS